MTAQEVCKVLGISLSTLRRRVSSGDLQPLPKAPGQKRVHRLNFSRADVGKLLQASTADSKMKSSAQEGQS